MLHDYYWVHVAVIMYMIYVGIATHVHMLLIVRLVAYI